MTRTLPGDAHKCTGFEVDAGELRTGCTECLRRVLPPADPYRVWYTAPPAVLVGGQCPLILLSETETP